MPGPAPTSTNIGRYGLSYDQAYGHPAQARQISTTNQRAPSSAPATTSSSSRLVSPPGSSAYDADDEKEVLARTAEKANKEKERKERNGGP